QLATLRPVEPDHVDQLGRSLFARRRRYVEQPAVEIERLFGIQEAVQVRLFGQVPQPLVFRDVSGVLPENQGLAAGGKQQAQQQLDRGGLARAVGTQQAENLTFADFQIEGFESADFLTAPEIAVNLGQASRFDNNAGRHLLFPRQPGWQQV